MEVLTGLDTFLVLALKGSFTATARELGVPRSTVSRRLARLEEELGVKLVERHTRSLKLTEAGVTLAERGRPIVSELRALRSDVRLARGKVQGSLRVSAPVGLGVDFLTAFVWQLRERAPNLRPELIIRDDVPDLLAERIDVAFCEGPLDDMPWFAHLVSEARHAIVVSPAYEARRGAPGRAEELIEHECLTMDSRQVPATRWPLLEGGSVGITPTLVSNDMQLIREAALAGLGVALLPTYAVAPDLLAGRLRVILPEVGRASSLHALSTRRRTESVKLDVFFSLLEDFSAAADATPDDQT